MFRDSWFVTTAVVTWPPAITVAYCTADSMPRIHAIREALDDFPLWEPHLGTVPASGELRS